MEWGSDAGSWHPARPRLLLHLDIDAFLASIEQLVAPRLIGKPVAVGTGVVASRSYEAKARGVQTAMRLSEARARCPELIVCEGDALRATRFRERVAAIVARHVPCVEVTSLDDLYADIGEVAASLDAARALAGTIRAEVRRETGLSVAQGLGGTRTLARLATTRAKPGGIFVVEPGSEREFLDGVPLHEIPGIGRKTAEQLALYRIERVAELRLVDLELLQASFGQRGEEIYWKLRGLPANERDQRVRPGGSRGADVAAKDGGVLELGQAAGAWGGGLGTQLSRSTSLWSPSGDPEYLRGLLSYLVDRASAALRAQRREAGRLDIGLQVEAEGGARAGRGPDFVRRGTALRPPTACRVVLTEEACALLEALLAGRRLVHKLGLTLTRLRPAPQQTQGELFDAAERARLDARLDAALDRLRAKHGFGSVLAGESIRLLGQLALGREGFRMRTPSLTL